VANELVDVSYVPSAVRELVRGSAVVVTGGAGFIGSHLVRALVAAGARRVRVLDDLGCGDAASVGAGVDLVRVRLGWDDPMDHFAGADYVFHLAAHKHNSSRDRPLDLVRANIDGTYQVLRAATAHRVRRMVFTSSLYVYGRMAGPPCREDDCPGPTTVYGISKLAGEHLVRHFATSFGLPGTILRLFFVYGPRQFAGMGYKSVIVKNFERLLAGAPPVIYGDGAQALDYVYVDDVVDALLRALDPDVAGELFNVASGVGIPVRDLVATMTDVAGARCAPAFEPADWTAGSSRRGSPAKIAERLGWRPRVDMREGLRRTVAWMREGSG